MILLSSVSHQKKKKKKKITFCLTATVLHSAPERFMCLHLLLKAHQKLTPHPPSLISSCKKVRPQNPMLPTKTPQRMSCFKQD